MPANVSEKFIHLVGSLIGAHRLEIPRFGNLSEKLNQCIRAKNLLWFRDVVALKNFLSVD